MSIYPSLISHVCVYVSWWFSLNRLSIYVCMRICGGWVSRKPVSNIYVCMCVCGCDAQVSECVYQFIILYAMKRFNW